MIRNVIFDFDDTLTRTHDGEYARHMRVAKELGLPILTKKQFLTLWGPPWSVFISILWPGCNVKKFERTYIARNARRTHKLIGGAKQTLSFLQKNNYETYLITSRDNRSLQRNLTHLGINNHFERIHSADHGQFHKPDPRVFLNFMDEHGIDAEESMYVGDLLIDYEGASKAGLTFVAVLTGAHSRARFIRAGLKPKYIIPSVKHLPAWLTRNNA